MSSNNRLSIKEIDFLKEHGRFIAGDASTENTVQLSALIQKGTREYLTSIQGSLNTDKADVAASLLMKRLAFLAVNCFLGMTAFQKALKVDPANIWLDSSMVNGVWLPKIRFQQVMVMEAPAKEREGWRQALYTELFQDVYTPLIERLAKDAKVSRQTLWENVMLYIYWLYDTVLPKLEITANKKEDFASLLAAPASLFGMNRNPAATFYKPKSFVEKHQAEIRIRTTCCYYYKANEKGKHCSTCPLDCKEN